MFENLLKDECGIDVNDMLGNEGAANKPVESTNLESLSVVDNAIYEATTFASEVNGFVSRANTLAGGVDQLIGLESIAKEAAADGGFTKRERQLIDSQVTALTEVVGLAGPEVPAMEHFGDSSPRTVATEMVGNEVLDTIKKWIDKLIAFIKKQFDALAKLWEKYTEAGQKLKRWAESKKADVEKLKVLKDKDAKITYPKSFVAADGVLKIDDVKKQSDALFDFTDKDIPKVVKMLDTAADGIKGSEEGPKLYESIWGGIKSMNPFGDESSDPEDKKHHGMKVMVSPVQLGGWRMKCSFPKDLPNDRSEKIKALSRFNMRVVDVHTKTIDDAEKRKERPLTTIEMSAYCSVIAKVADGTTRLKKSMDKSKGELNTVASALKVKDEQSVRELAPLLQKFTSCYSSGPGAATQKAIVALRQLAGVINDSVKCYKS